MVSGADPVVSTGGDSTGVYSHGVNVRLCVHRVGDDVVGQGVDGSKPWTLV